jgi:pSer/pThr/pTyr-binding forkhead associated (FHA) protein
MTCVVICCRGRLCANVDAHQIRSAGKPADDLAVIWAMADAQVTLRNADVITAPVIKLFDGTIMIGRDPTCGIVLADRSVSRFHAQLAVQGTSITVRDLGSRNGTYIDTERINSSALGIGQRLCLGAVHFAVELLSRRPDSDERFAETASVDDSPPDLENLPLSAAERRVFELMLPGLSEKRIAGRLGLSRHTVHSHVRKIYESFCVRSRAELMAKFVNPPNGRSAN